MNKNFKFAVIWLFFLFIFMAAVPARTYAVPSGERKEIKEEIKEREATRPGLLQKIAGKFARAAIVNGTISAKNGMTLTVTKDGKTYTVQTDGKTQFRRRFWGKGSLDEIQTGDSVNVHGKWADDAKTTIQATLVRDLSVQKRFGVFFGTVTSVTGSGWVMDTINRGSQTASVSAGTRFVNRRGQTIARSDIAIGHRVRVRGLWDNKANTVTEVTHVKDFSLPLIPTPTK